MTPVLYDKAGNSCIIESNMLIKSIKRYDAPDYKSKVITVSGYELYSHLEKKELKEELLNSN